MYTDKAARSNVGGGWHEGHKPAPPRPANSTVAGGSRIIIQSRLDHISSNHQAGHAAGHHVLGMAQPASSVMPNMLKKESGSGVQRPTTANGGTMSKIRQSGAKFLHKTAQRLSLREEPPEAPESASGAGPSESTSSGSVSQHAGPSSRQDRTSQSSAGVHSKPNQSTASATTSAISKPERASGAGSAVTRPERPPSAGSTSKAPFGKKAATPQPEPRPAPTPLKRRSASTDAACGTGSGAGRPRPSAVRHRDRPRDGGKVCFAPRVQMLGPSDSEERQERDDSPLAEEQEQERQAESMRRLERENESLRHAIENYRDLERRRAAGGSGGTGGAGQDAKGQEETAEDGEEDEVEKAVEVSPSGVFLKFSEEIGRGSFKAVYKGLDTTTGVFVAWCELQLSGNRLSKKERDRFREEAGLMKGLTHPNIVRFYDFWEVDKPKRSCIVLVTELMTSGTLRTYLKNFGQKRVSLKIIKQWCRQILRGLQFLHSRNPPIIHRDLKCDNIFISGTTGQVKVGDLGLATLKNRSFAKSVIGTPEFMAPEVYEEHYDEAVDVYAFGMCMLEMVTSEYPYSECTGPAQIYKKVITGIKPSSFDKIDDPQTRDLIEWCTRLNSKERPTVKQLLNHEFFAEDCGMRLEVANREEAMNSGSSVIHLQLRVLDAKKRKDTHKENEAIQFNYVLNKDNPEETAKQMLMSGLLAEENCRPLAKMITNVIQSLVRAREERRRDQVPQTQSAPAAGPPGAAPGPGASLVPTAAAPAPVPLHLSASLPVISSSQSAQPAAAQVHTATAVLSAAPGAPLASVAAAAPVTVTVAATQTQPSHQPGGTETAPAETRQAEPPPPAAPTEAAGAQPQHGQTEAHSDSATGAESDSALGERKEKKNRARRRKTCERLPRLTVLEVKNSDNGPVVSCLLETNQSQAITFKFDLHEADVTAISHKMTEAQLLPKDDAQYFEEQLRAVVRRQRELRSTGANQPPPPPHADEDTHPAQSAEDSAGDVSTPVSSSGSSAGGSPRPRPTELAPPPPPPSGQVAERAVPVLVRAPHGLQIVTLTTQQAAALLRQSQAAAAAALLAPVLGAAAPAAAAAASAAPVGSVSPQSQMVTGRATSPTPFPTASAAAIVAACTAAAASAASASRAAPAGVVLAGGSPHSGALTTAVAALPPELLSTVVSAVAPVAHVADVIHQTSAAAPAVTPLLSGTVVPGSPGSPPIDVTAVFGAHYGGVSKSEALAAGVIGPMGSIPGTATMPVTSISVMPGISPISAVLTGGAVSSVPPISLLPAVSCGGGHVSYTTPSPVLAAPVPLLSGREPDRTAPAAAVGVAAHSPTASVIATTGATTITAALAASVAASGATLGLAPSTASTLSSLTAAPTSPTISPRPMFSLSSSATSSPTTTASSVASSPLASASVSGTSCAAPVSAVGAAAPGVGTPAASTPPVQATGRRSRFIVSSVVESKASPMPSPCLLSPASEQPLNILTSAGSATTSVSPSPQVALISPEPLSPPPVSSALHSPQDPAPTALSPSATPALSTSPVPAAGVGETAGPSPAAGQPVGQGSTSAPVGPSVAAVEPAGSDGTPTAPIAVPSGSSQKSDGQARPPSLSISPGSRTSQAKSGATVTTPTAQRHVRFAVTPTILNPVCPSSSDSSLASVTAVTSASDSQSVAASGSGVQTSLAGPSSHATTSVSSTAPLASSTAAVGPALGPAPALSATTPVSASLTAPSGLTPSPVTGGTSPGTLSPSAPSPGTLSPTGVMDSSHPTPTLSPGEVPSHPAGATISEAHRASAVAQEGRPPAPARPVTGGQSLPTAEEPEERRTAAGPQEQPTTPIDASMGNLAHLAKQLNRLTSQPGEAAAAAGSGTQTPSDGAPTARRLTATGAGPTPTQRSGADGGGGTPSPSQQSVPLQPAGTGVSATGSPADLSRSASGTDAAAAAGSEARRKQVPLHLTDLAKKLDKLRVKPPGGAAVASAAAGTASTAVQTTTPLDEASKPLAVGAQPVATPSGPPPETARAQPSVNQMDVQAATSVVNGTASDVSPEGASRPVRRGRFAISKATTAAQPPAPAPAAVAAPAPSAAQTPSPVTSVEEMAMYRELIARQQAEMIELLRQQEVERENLRQRLRQQHQQQHEQQLQQQQQQQRHPPCTENGPV